MAENIVNDFGPPSTATFGSSNGTNADETNERAVIVTPVVQVSGASGSGQQSVAVRSLMDEIDNAAPSSGSTGLSYDVVSLVQESPEQRCYRLEDRDGKVDDSAGGRKPCDGGRRANYAETNG